jgi:hypothetical protein
MIGGDAPGGSGQLVTNESNYRAPAERKAKPDHRNCKEFRSLFECIEVVSHERCLTQYRCQAKSSRYPRTQTGALQKLRTCRRGTVAFTAMSPIAPLPHCPIAPLPHCPIAPLPHCPIAPFAPIAPLPHCPIAPLPHCPVAPLPHCPIAPLPHCLIAPLPHCPTPFGSGNLQSAGRRGDRPIAARQPNARDTDHGCRLRDSSARTPHRGRRPLR